MDFPLISLILSIQPTEQSKGNLYLGGFKATKQEVLEEKQINAVVTIITEYEVKINKDKSHLHIKILDKQEENIQSYFDESFQFIEENLKKTNVLVHCAYGVSRSASITIAFLMKFQKQTFWKALVYVQQRRNCINPNEGFQNQLLKYQQEILGSDEENKD